MMSYVIYCKSINQYWYVDPKTNKPVMVADINKARVFDEHHIAKNVLTCIPKGWQNHKFEILEHNVVIPKVPKITSKPLNEQSCGSLEQKHKFLDAIQKQIQAYVKEQKQLLIKLEELQMIQEDILHKLENDDIDNPEDALLLAKYTKSIRQQRRDAKNNLYVINEFFKLNVPSLAKVDTLDSVTKMEALTKQCVYNPRLLTRLFEDDWVEFLQGEIGKTDTSEDTTNTEETLENNDNEEE